jgi:hypothetical protein
MGYRYASGIRLLGYAVTKRSTAVREDYSADGDAWSSKFNPGGISMTRGCGP